MLGQLAMPELIDGAYWVTVCGHGIIKDGTRFLVVQDRGDGWLVAWKDGIQPRHSGTLLKRGQVERV
jgi:hypothetical protein